MTAFEEQIKNKAFKKAAQTNKEIQTLLDQASQNRHPEEMLLQQALGIQILLDQILADRSQKINLAKQINENKKRLRRREQTHNQTIDSLKTLIKSLNRTVQTLEKQKIRLEEQIERMKQIDLK